MKKSRNDTDSPQDRGLPVFGRDAEGKKKRGFNCVLIDGERYIESVGRDGRRIQTPVSEARAAFRQLELREEAPEWK